MSKKRRDRGTGNLRQRANGTWEGRYGYIDDLTGKRITKSVYAKTANPDALWRKGLRGADDGNRTIIHYSKTLKIKEFQQVFIVV